MALTTVPRIQVKQVVLGSTGRLSSGTITPSTPGGADKIPNRLVAADVYNASAYTFGDQATVMMPVDAGLTVPFPGSYVRDILFSAGTYIIVFYLDA